MFREQKDFIGRQNVTLGGDRVDFDAVVAVMDDAIREDIHAAMAPCTKQAFVDAYCLAHKAKFNADFVLN